MADILKIGFPEGLLAERPVRLDVPFCKEGAFIAIEKPAGMFLEADGIAENPQTIVGAIRAQKGKAEFERLGLEAPYAVYPLEPEISGLCLLASNKDAAAELRNSLGSGNFEFEYTILSERPLAPVYERIDLPVLKHEEKPRAIVSHRFGKKCYTDFTLSEDLGDFQIWKAKTKFFRWHQLRLHAAEAGIRPIGEDTYVRVKKVLFSKFKKGELKNKEDAQVYSELCIHLSNIRFKYMGETFEISSALPQKFEVLLKKIRAKYSV